MRNQTCILSVTSHMLYHVPRIEAPNKVNHHLVYVYECWSPKFTLSVACVMKIQYRYETTGCVDEFCYMCYMIKAGRGMEDSSVVGVKSVWKQFRAAFPLHNDTTFYVKGNCPHPTWGLHCYMAVKYGHQWQMIYANSNELKSEWWGGWLTCHWKHGNLVQKWLSNILQCLSTQAWVSQDYPMAVLQSIQSFALSPLNLYA